MLQRFALLFGLLALLAQPRALPQAAAPTAAPVYNIELIVFRSTGPSGAGEDWSFQAGKRRFSAAGESGAAGTTMQVGHFVRSIPPSQHQLDDIERKLRVSGRYEPVAHVAWSQTPSPWGSRAGFALQKLGIDVPGLNGMIYLERGQFLHLGMALDYAPETNPLAAPGTTFTLSEIRRIRFYERNYFDHPAFGVIALVTPAQGARPPGR